jgi:phytoene dehydrogenase-like protein
VLDDSLAPAGAHVASLFCQHVSPQFADGSTWDQHRETVADLMIDTVEAYAPGFKASVIGRQSLAPLDLERIFSLPNGDIFHGALTLDQLFSARQCWDTPATECRYPVSICVAPVHTPAVE